MAKKIHTSDRPVTRGKETAKKIQGLADDIMHIGMKHGDPALDIPTRNLSNVSFNGKTPHHRDGRRQADAQLFQPRRRPRSSCRRC